ncbi:MAG: hypothetical protein KAX49_19905 [Halanaerobiales bacterium]|nr:hypothetical protein [Halanaerobiales bacterium]
MLLAEVMGLFVAYSVVEYIFREKLNLILRTFVFMVVMLAEFMVVGIWPSEYIAIPISGITYLVISIIMDKFIRSKKGKEFKIFMIKQSFQIFIISIAFLFAAVSFYPVTATWQGFWHNHMRWELILLIVIANIWLAPRLIRTVLNDLTHKTCEVRGGGKIEEHLEDGGAYHAGTLIGILERLLILTILLLSGGLNISVIGFLLGTKSLARFKKFDNQEFVEYFIVGTMTSVLFALVSVLPLYFMGI